jgi:Resolvase, N terminal domain
VLDALDPDEWRTAGEITVKLDNGTWTTDALRGVGHPREVGGWASKCRAVVVVRMDRLGRDAAEQIALLKRLRSKVGLVAIAQQIDLATPHGRAMAQIGAVFNELEPALIAELSVYDRTGWTGMTGVPGMTGVQTLTLLTRAVRPVTWRSLSTRSTMTWGSALDSRSGS